MNAPVRVAVVGCAGVPNRYGGFESLAENLARQLDPQRVHLAIYCQRSLYTPDLSPEFHGHERRFVPLAANGAQSIPYDLWSMADSVWRGCDAVLVLGVSGAWGLPAMRRAAPRVRVVVNIDGMEWRRDKFSPSARRLLQQLERIAVVHADAVIADNAGIENIARERYGVAPVVIAYGGDHTLVAPEAMVPPDNPPPPGHDFALARIEPENNCALILEAYASGTQRLAFVGNWDRSDYGRALKARFEGDPALTLLDPVYEQPRLGWWRAHARAYVHGHSVGGTNPSLVEAIFWHDRILAFDCEFNRATLGGEGGYFSSSPSLRALAPSPPLISPSRVEMLRDRYRWRTIADAYARALGAAGAVRAPAPGSPGTV